MKITKQEIKFLSSVFTDVNRLSPFVLFDAGLAGNEYETLLKKGIIQGNAYDKHSLHLLTQLTNPLKAFQLFISNNFYSYHSYDYQCVDSRIHINIQGDVCHIEEVANDDKLRNVLPDYLGISSISVPFTSLTLHPTDVLVLAAIFDLYRIHKLKSLAGIANTLPDLNPETINGVLRDHNPEGLIQMLQLNYSIEIPENNSILDSLGRLETSGVLIKKPVISLSDEFALIANNCLIPETIARYSINEMAGDQLIILEKVAISFGLHCALSFKFDQKTFLFHSISSQQLYGDLLKSITIPEIAGYAITNNQTDPTRDLVSDHSEGNTMIQPQQISANDIKNVEAPTSNTDKRSDILLPGQANSQLPPIPKPNISSTTIPPPLSGTKAPSQPPLPASSGKKPPPLPG